MKSIHVSNSPYIVWYMYQGYVCIGSLYLVLYNGTRSVFKKPLIVCWRSYNFHNVIYSLQVKPVGRVVEGIWLFWRDRELLTLFFQRRLDLCGILIGQNAVPANFVTIKSQNACDCNDLSPILQGTVVDKTQQFNKLREVEEAKVWR
jgi:hypothetical protein